jgi:hypothetical protein
MHCGHCRQRALASDAPAATTTHAHERARTCGVW